MRTYTYPALFEEGDNAGIVVTFRDLPEAITQGNDAADARAMASEVLGLTLLHYVSLNRSLPSASQVRVDEALVTADAEHAAKLAVIEAFHESGLSKTDFAGRLGKDEREVRRILNPDHATKMPTLVTALGALGRRFVLGVEAA